MIGMRKNIGVGEAIAAIHPNAKWAVFNDNYDEIQWYSEDIELPSRQQIEEKIAELKANEGMTAVREIRNWYLQQSDWTQAQDIRSIRGKEWCDAWDSYRNTLRNITESGIDPYFDEFDVIHGVVWPEKPPA